MQEKNSQDAEKILQRAKLFLNLRKNKDLAAALGVAQSTISTWIARNTIDYEKIFAICEGADKEWLITGAGDSATGVQIAEGKNQSYQNEDPAILQGRILELREQVDQMRKEIAKILTQTRKETVDQVMEYLTELEQKAKASEPSSDESGDTVILTATQRDALNKMKSIDISKGKAKQRTES